MEYFDCTRECNYCVAKLCEKKRQLCQRRGY
nr:MAG TPA: hypothetical protein [Crassvirales sp.]